MKTCIYEATRTRAQRLVRIKEHIAWDKSWHIYKNLNTSIGCKDTCSNDCFSILDMAPTSYQLKIIEGLFIGLEQPSLNM